MIYPSLYLYLYIFLSIAFVDDSACCSLFLHSLIHDWLLKSAHCTAKNNVKFTKKAHKGSRYRARKFTVWFGMSTSQLLWWPTQICLGIPTTVCVRVRSASSHNPSSFILLCHSKACTWACFKLWLTSLINDLCELKQQRPSSECS